MDEILSDAVLILLKTELCASHDVELVTLWTSSSSVRPLPPLWKVHQCHSLSLLTYCSSITSVRVTCLFVEVIAARVMPPTWHMRLVSALTAAMPISSTETEAWQPTHKHTCKHHADTYTHTHRATTPLWGARWWHRTGALVTVFLASQHEEYNGACLAGGVRGQTQGEGGVRTLERYIVHTVHTAAVSFTHLLCCKRSRTFFFFFLHTVSQVVCGEAFRWLIQSTSIWSH